MIRLDATTAFIVDSIATIHGDHLLAARVAGNLELPA